jgi:hypothetical protein
MALGFIKNILGKHKRKLGTPSSGMLEPSGSIRMDIPVTFTFTQDEIDRYGFTASEQLARNPRLQEKLRRCI